MKTRVLVIFFCVILAVMGKRAHGGWTVTSVALQGEAIAGGNLDSFHESTTGFFDAVASFEVGLAESYLASAVVSASIEDDTITLMASTLADSAGPSGSAYFAEASGSGEIGFTLAKPHLLESFVEGPSSRLVNQADGVAVDLASISELPAGDYRLAAEAYSSAGTDGSSLSITLTAIPEPAPLTMLAAGVGLMAVRRGRH